MKIETISRDSSFMLPLNGFEAMQEEESAVVESKGSEFV